MEIRAVPRLLAIIAFAALLTGCSAPASGGEPTAPRLESAPAAPAEPPPAAPDQPQPPDGGCQITATSGSISSTGGSSRTATVNGEISFACEDGPMLMIAAIDDAGVTFVGEDGERVTIAPGSSGSAGGYAISVASVAGGTAEFQVLPE